MLFRSEANGSEAREVAGIKVFAASTLAQAFQAINAPSLFTYSKEEPGKDGGFIPQGSVDVDGVLFPAIRSGFEFSDVVGQSDLIRALQIAAAGSHNLLAFGPPGCGKTLSIQKSQALFPLLTLTESQSVTRIYSLAGLLAQSEPSIRTAPFRMPHQSASLEGICGGGDRKSVV